MVLELAELACGRFAAERPRVMPQPPLVYDTPPPEKARMGPLAQGAIVLLAYPFCLLANVMSFAAVPAQGAAPKLALRLASGAFLWSSTLYPVVYLLAAAVSLFLSSNDRAVAARRVAQVPLVYLLGVLLCFAAWLVAEQVTP